MKYFSISILALVIGLISLVSCEKESELEMRSDDINKQLPQKMMSGSMSIGAEHNLILTEFLTENQNMVLLSYSERRNLMESWFMMKYSWDIELLLNRFQSFESGNPLALQNYTPQSYLNSIESEVDVYLYSQINEVVNQSYLLRSSEVDLHTLISNYKVSAMGNTNFSSNEDKLLFIDMLDVMDHSVTLWYNYNYGTNNNFPAGLVTGVSEDDYWKIAASDFLGGIAGGLPTLGLGALPGMAVASGQMIIGLW
jgi:hypothetical protein